MNTLHLSTEHRTYAASIVSHDKRAFCVYRGLVPPVRISLRHAKAPAVADME